MKLILAFLVHSTCMFTKKFEKGLALLYVYIKCSIVTVLPAKYCVSEISRSTGCDSVYRIVVVWLHNFESVPIEQARYPYTVLSIYLCYNTQSLFVFIIPV